MKLSVVCGILLLLGIAAAQAEIKPSVKPYHVDSTLSNIANFSEFKDALDHYNRKPFVLSDAQRRAVSQNGFVVVPGNAEQFFEVYESEHYGMKPRIPNFITADAALQMYHLLYDFTLKAIETEALYPALKDLTAGMMAGSLKQAESATDSVLRAAAMRNVVLFAVPARLLELEVPALAPQCAADVDAELAKIKAQSGRDDCKATGYGMDYTQFAVRGHYTRSPEMQAFFQAMMWYGIAGLPLEPPESEGPGAAYQTLMITDLLFADADDAGALIRLWDKIYSITALYVGTANNIEPHQVWNAIPRYRQESPLAEQFLGERQFEDFASYLNSIGGPRIVHQAEGLPAGKQFRFMSQRFMLDSYVLQKLSLYPVRSFPKGLDVMAVLGSPRAAEILDAKPEAWKEYRPRRDSLTAVFGTYDAEWSQSLVSGWLYALQALVEARGEGYPSFMRNSAWQDKQLNTALSSWSEMRRDVILYATPSYAEGGDGADEIKQPKGYVEPAVEFWSRLLKQVQQNRRILMAAGYLADDMSSVFARYEDMIAFFHAVSVKELTGVKLTEDEYERIRNFGATVEFLSLDMLKLDHATPIHDERTGDAGSGETKSDIRDVHMDAWFQVTGPDRDVACIADVHTSEGRCLEEAVGHIDDIYVVVPIEGKLHLTRGGVFSYYEFEYPAPHRLNDEAWQEMIRRGRAPERPAWTSSFVIQ